MNQLVFNEEIKYYDLHTIFEPVLPFFSRNNTFFFKMEHFFQNGSFFSFPAILRAKINEFQKILRAK